MNCLLEALAGVYLTARARLMADPVEEEVYSAHDNLEKCRRTMEGRELEYLEESRKLAGAALACRGAGNMAGSRARILDRRRVIKRLEKLRGGMALVDAQLDAIRSNELDREIIMTLKASSSAMKKAGIGAEALNVEQVMGELDDTLRDTQEITQALSAPLVYGDEDLELDEELEWLEETPLLDPGMAYVPRVAPAAPAPRVAIHAPDPEHAIHASAPEHAEHAIHTSDTTHARSTPSAIPDTEDA